ncbi:MAG: adenylate/guanylate cyclase domain-containing protein [Nitriliruptorales bacterium]|nr:adenylate/guanylate cyclase domain-containing protein [Nitriliruptorales bacterium]
MNETVTLPSGEVTFLFTDIVGSTQRWEQDPAQMRAALEVHDLVVRDAVDGHAGWIVKDTGDGVMAVFDEPLRAVEAAASLQQRLAEADWPGTPLQVRSGVHRGPAQPVAGDYHAPAVNRCARVMAVAHGGQVLVTREVRDAITRDTPDTPDPDSAHLGFRDLGEHRLKDLDRPVMLYQVTVPGLPVDFPPLRSLSATPNNLPHVATTLVGRDEETATVTALLGRERLVTLTGAGGIGKTRLALHAAAEALEDFSDGAWLVELAPLSDPALVGSAVASALRLPDTPGRDVRDVVLDHVSGRELLLIMDNCEHLIAETAAITADIIQRSPRTRVLATTREPLGVPGEHIFAVQGLGTGADAPAVDLFIERMQAAGASPPSDDDLPTIATICRRLDGLPLAIELAAARTRLLTCEDIAARLDERFSLLTGGSRTALPRQRTLEAAVAWSYDLLDPRAQLLLRRLSVFASSFSLRDVESVCGTDPLEPAAVLELVAELADRSLLTVEREDGARYRMLETIRAYARERLLESGDDLPTLRRRHLQWSVDQATTAASHLDGPDQLVWLRRTATILDDHRTAMEWASINGHHALGATIAVSLYRYWYIRAVREGRYWVERFADHVDDLPEELAARVLFTHGSLVQTMGEYERATALLERSVALYEDLDNPRGLAYAVHYLMRASWGLRSSDEVRAMCERALEIFREVADPVGIGLTLLFIAVDELERDHIDEALEVLEQCDAVMRRIGAPQLVAHPPEITAWGLTAKNEDPQAATKFAEAITLYKEVRNRLCTAHCLENVSLLLARHDPDTAAVLLGAMEAIREDIGVPVPPYENISFGLVIRAVEAHFDAETLSELWDRGRDLTPDEALDRALSAVNALL